MGSEVMNITESVEMLQEIGFFNFILPFGIFFLILFGILDQYQIVSKDKRVNAVLALFISAFILLYAYVNKIEWFFALFYTKMSIALVILLFALTFAVFVYRGMKENGMIPAGSEKAWVAGIVFGSVMIMQMAFQNAPGEVGKWAAQVSGVVMTMGLIGAVISFFLAGKIEEKEGE